MKKTISLLCIVMLLLCSCSKEKADTPSADDSVTLADTSDFDLEFDEDEIDTQTDTVAIELTDTYDIFSGGSYTLSGEKKDTTVTVDVGDADVQLIFDNFSLTNSSGPALYIKSAGNVELTLKDGTTNMLSDGSDYNISDSGSQLDGAIFSRADLIINGTGTLEVDGNYKHGIVSKDDLIITSCSVAVNAANVGLNGKDCVKVNDSDITINAGSDGIRSDNTEDADRGYVYIVGGCIDITSGHDGIQAETILKTESTEIDIKAGEGSTASLSSSDESFKGLKAGSDILISGGNYEIDSQDDCVHSNGTVSVEGGTLLLSSGDDGIHADTDFSLSDGNITVSKSYEGIEGSKIVLSGGNTDVTASDDGLNAAGGNDLSGMGSRPGHGGFTSSTGSIVISGGRHLITASGDGVDSNGTIAISGGVTFVSGPENGGNGALDYDGSASVTGGTFVALGSVGMAQNLSDAQNQCAALVSFNTVSGGTVLSVCDDSGKELISFTPQNSYSCAVITSPDIQSGNSYTIKSDGEIVTEFDVTDSITGSGSGMMPGGGGMMPGGGGGMRPGGFMR